jgi:hypothetical protein
MGLAGGSPDRYVAVLFAGFSQKNIWVRIRCWFYIRHRILANFIRVFWLVTYTSEDLFMNRKAWR